MVTSATRARIVGTFLPPRISIRGGAAAGDLRLPSMEKHGVEALRLFKEWEAVRLVWLGLKSRKLKSRLVRDWSLHLCEDRLNCVNRWSVSGSRATAIQFMPKLVGSVFSDYLWKLFLVNHLKTTVKMVFIERVESIVPANSCLF